MQPIGRRVSKPEVTQVKDSPVYVCRHCDRAVRWNGDYWIAPEDGSWLCMSPDRKMGKHVGREITDDDMFAGLQAMIAELVD